MLLNFYFQSMLHCFSEEKRQNLQDYVHIILSEPQQVIEVYKFVLLLQCLSYFFDNVSWKSAFFY